MNRLQGGFLGASLLLAACSGGTSSGTVVPSTQPAAQSPAASGSPAKGAPQREIVRKGLAGTLTVIHTFAGSDGSTPMTGLARDAGGNLYGATFAGGTSQSGTIFRLKPSGSGWTFSSLYNFSGGSDGAAPRTRLVFGPDGALYGTTYNGGVSRGCTHCGVVFRLTPNSSFCGSASCPWTESVLYRFTGGADGGWPSGDIAFDSAGNIYGTTQAGGNLSGPCGNSGCGVVYQLTGSGNNRTEHVLYAFGQYAGDGLAPWSGVALGRDNNLYGTTVSGGSGSQQGGTVFELARNGSSWNESILESFPGGLALEEPRAALTFDSTGAFYGAANTSEGGAIFKETPSGSAWTFSILYAFNFSMKNQSGDPNAAMSVGLDGNFYSTTTGGTVVNHYGSVYEVTPQGQETDLYEFSGGTDGKYPYSTTSFDASGNIYGTTSAGGANGDGVVFEFSSSQHNGSKKR